MLLMKEDLDNVKSENIWGDKTFLWSKCGIGRKGVIFQMGTIYLAIYVNMLLI